MPHAFCSNSTNWHDYHAISQSWALGAPASRRLTFSHYKHCSPITMQAAAGY
jgi:hypothetical protein